MQRRLVVEKGPGKTPDEIDEMPAAGFDADAKGFGDGDDDDFFGGDVSSIMIKPDQIMHDRDIANE